MRSYRGRDPIEKKRNLLFAFVSARPHRMNPQNDKVRYVLWLIVVALEVIDVLLLDSFCDRK
jgi:hypothetical protein